MGGGRLRTHRAELNPQGQVLLTLGTKRQAGEWNEAAQSRRVNERTLRSLA